MAVYAIGDVQGCYSSLCRLLDTIRFDESVDQLWFCGDLVNRGPESLQTLRFIRSLGENAISVLGNHDLHCLALYHQKKRLPKKDTLFELLNSQDCDELMAWLQSLPLLYFSESLSRLLVHAGIHPHWTLSQALTYAGEVEDVLRGDRSNDFFNTMYGNKPDRWDDDLSDMARLRCITNVFTRMRFLYPDDRLDMDAKGAPHQHEELIPWFKLGCQIDESVEVIFGHWSTLPVGSYGRHHAIDGGCNWGGKFVALRVDQSKPSWYSINCRG